MEPRVRFWSHQANIWARGPFDTKKWVPQKIVLWWNDFRMRLRGIPPDPNESYGPWDPFGCSILSKNLLKTINSRDFRFSWKIAGGPCHLHVPFPIPP